MEKEKEYLFKAWDICKNFGTTRALDHVSFHMERGEIRGLIGENGSGKSTLSSIIAGTQKASSGSMVFKEKPWEPHSGSEAQKNGISMIVQEAGTIPNITVAENIFLGCEELFQHRGIVSRRKMIAAAAELFQRLGIGDVDPSALAAELDFQDRKIIEIAKALYWDPDIFIVDETTTAVSQIVRDHIYRIIHEMVKQGKSVLIISHDIDELIEHCDTLTVLRDGVCTAELTKEDFDSDLIKQLMVGREIKNHFYRSDMDGYEDEVVLKADNITTARSLMNFSLELHKGEILGIGGLSHCGMHSLGHALFGAEEVLAGQVTVGPKQVRITSTKGAIRNKVGYISKNRDSESLALSSPIRDNIAVHGYKVNRFFGPLISYKKEKDYVNRQIEQLSIKCASQYHEVSTLSGGNKQKVAFGQWLASDTDIFILDCPTRGVDIGVKTAMYELMYGLKKAGKSIILISEELPELIGMSDRIIIMKDGKTACEAYRTEGVTEQQLVQYMF